jgi:hypothetical protein
MNSHLALLGGYGLKGGNLLSYSSGLTFRASEFLFSVFRDRYSHGKRLIALLADEIVYRHATSPFPGDICTQSNMNLR